MKENIGEQLRDEYINFFSQYVNNGDIDKLVDKAVKSVSGFVKFKNGNPFKSWMLKPKDGTKDLKTINQIANTFGMKAT